MKLIFIYGPPAVGKYTVGKELSRLTGYKLFHNHVAIEMVRSVFEIDNGTRIDSSTFWKLVTSFREQMVEEAAKQNVDLIMTYVYNYPTDTKSVMRLVRLVEKHGGRVFFVRLYTKKEVLHERMKAASRKAFSKIRDGKLLDTILERAELFTDVPHKDNISIDNTNIGPRTVAEKIVSHYRLK